MADYHVGYQRLDELWYKEDCTREPPAQEIEAYCIGVAKKKATEKNISDTSFHFDGCINQPCH